MRKDKVVRSGKKATRRDDPGGARTKRVETVLVGQLYLFWFADGFWTIPTTGNVNAGEGFGPQEENRKTKGDK